MFNARISLFLFLSLVRPTPQFAIFSFDLSPRLEILNILTTLDSELSF